MFETINPNKISNHYIYRIDKIVELGKSDSVAVLDNKSYVCIREATKNINGLILAIHDGYCSMHEEKFI